MKPTICGAARSGFSCERERGHSGDHRAYNEQIDEQLFWSDPTVPDKEVVRALRADVARLTTERDEVSKALDECAAPDPEKPLAQRVRDELSDFRMIIDHCSEAYDHFSRGRISKPNTLPTEVIAVSDDLLSEDINEAVREATEELQSQLDEARARLQARDFSGRELAILAAVLNRCRGWDDPRELERFLSTASECIGPEGFTDVEMDALAEKLADVWYKTRAGADADPRP